MKEPSDRENSVSGAIVDAAFHIHRELGPGLLESVYEVVLASELRDRGFSVRRQVPIPIRYKNVKFDEGFRADIIVNDLVLVELKSVEQIHSAHKKQLLSYLKLTNLGPAC